MGQWGHKFKAYGFSLQYKLTTRTAGKKRDRVYRLKAYMGEWMGSHPSSAFVPRIVVVGSRVGSPHCAWRSSWFVAPLCRHWFRCRRWCLVVFSGSSPLLLVPVVGGCPLSRVVLRHRQWLSLLSRVVTRCHWWLPAVVGGPPLLAVALPRWWSLCHRGWLPVVGSGPPLPWGLVVACRRQWWCPVVVVGSPSSVVALLGWW